MCGVVGVRGHIGVSGVSGGCREGGVSGGRSGCHWSVVGCSCCEEA